MSYSKVTLPPYPVQIGSVRHCSPERHLQEYVECGNYAKVKKMLKKGILPDATNSLGQTPLFVAALLGLRKIVELLLNFGSKPNHRCIDWSTPVHAAAFSCDQWIMIKLIDAGGDLRLHDEKSKRPYDWALIAGKDESAQMIEFIDCCTAHIQALIHFYPLKPKKIDSSRNLTNSASFIDLFSPRNSNKSILKFNQSENHSVKKAGRFGYGQFCVRDNGQAGFLLTFPFIEEKSLVQEESKPIFSFAAGPYMSMRNLLWGSTEVTVKGLSDMAHNTCFADLLIAEEENMSYLQHPLILQLLALSTSPSLERKQLVFERVTCGSFYNILHERRSEYPILHLGTIVPILLQMIEALIFLHWRGFIHRSFSSHAIQIVSAGRAKLSNFEYMVESKDNKKCDGIVHFPIPKQLYYWSSPEVVAGKTGTTKSDLYSFCAVMQESLTDSLPWNGVDGEAVKDSMISGHYLTVDPTLCEPYYSIVSAGIQARPEERTTHLHDIGYLLKNDVKHLPDTVPFTKHAHMIVEAGRNMKVQRIEQEIPPEITWHYHCTGCSTTTAGIGESFDSLLFTAAIRTSLIDVITDSSDMIARACITMETAYELPVYYTFEEITSRFYKERKISSHNSSKAASSTESQSETLCDMVEQTNELNAHLHSLEKKGEKMAGDFCQQQVGGSPISLLLFSDSERGTSSDTEEEDIDFRSIETYENWQAELQTLDNRLNSIQIHNKSTLDNLLNIQRFLQEHNTVLDAKEERKQYKNVCMKENEFPYNDTDEVDHVLPFFKSKPYAEWSAKGPPLHYIPPESASYSGTDITSETRRIQSESVVDTGKKASKKGKWFNGLGSIEGKTLEKISTGQNLLQLTKRSSKKSQADNDEMIKNQYASLNSAPQWPTKLCSRKGVLVSSSLKSGSQHLQNKKHCDHICDNDEEEQTEKSSEACCGENEESKLEKLFRHFAGKKYQSQENEDHCEIPVEMEPLQDNSKDTDDSNLSTDTSYFTPEIDVSVEKTEQETLNVCDESDHTFGEWISIPSSTMCFDKTLLTWTGERALEKNMPGLTTIELSTNTRSTIDVENLSSFSCDEKTSLLQFTTPRNMEVSARHSTPLSPGKLMLGATSKRRSFLENQLKSPNTSDERSFASLSSNKNVSRKTPECFLSAMCDSTDYNISSHQEKTFTMKDQNASNAPFKNRSDEDALPGPQCLLNKTDRECQSMEITCLINETICDHSESADHTAHTSDYRTDHLKGE
ncbi:inactive serine/threonine-protein kinase TEX14 isoform X2 [Rhinoderma darwinii]|uniref:inactive serine/threonine-protein kinase TEX14 isoform X2 n=1 Tax=Rhinoderma darwinii TaxID=43563 RepID=UPI003F6664F5